MRAGRVPALEVAEGCHCLGAGIVEEVGVGDFELRFLAVLAERVLIEQLPVAFGGG